MGDLATIQTELHSMQNALQNLPGLPGTVQLLAETVAALSTKVDSILAIGISVFNTSSIFADNARAELFSIFSSALSFSSQTIIF